MSNFNLITRYVACRWLLLGCLLVGAAGWTQTDGKFLGSVVAQWVDAEEDHRKMKLLNDFGYVDPNGKIWQVMKGTVIDDSSIPKAVWPQVGSPLIGPYQEAAVIHNHYCKIKKEHWFMVHRMIYDASLTAGLSETEAKVLFAGVFAYGQRWLPAYGKNGISATTFTFQGYQLINVSVSETDFNETVEWINTENPSVHDIIVRLHCLIKEKKEKRLFKLDNAHQSVSTN